MLRLLTIAACALVVGGGFAIPRLGFATSAPPDKAAALQRLGSVATTDSSTEPVAPPESASRRPIPARMLGPDSPIPIPPSVLLLRNGWLMSDGRTLVAVYAGAAGNDPSVGRLVVVRQNLASGAQTVRIVDVGATGPLAITAAPLGTVGRSGEIGNLALRTDGGRELRFDLGGRGTSQEAHEARLRWLSRPTRSSDQAPYPQGR